ncbi:hypothetical protein D3C81_2176400 [compost metagenome]
MWKVVNDRESLKDKFVRDFLVEVRIIEELNINDWKYMFQVVEDIEDTYLEIVANNGNELKEEIIEEILKKYDVR